MLTYIVYNYKFLSQEDYDNSLNNIDYSSITCPDCGKTAFIRYGHYRRTIFLLNDNPLHFCFILKVQRIYCKHCHHTHSLLPSLCIPYSHFVLHDAVRLLTSSIDELSHELDMNIQLTMNLIKSLKNAFHAHSKYTVSDLMNLTSFKVLIDDFFTSFLHQHKNIRIYSLNIEKSSCIRRINLYERFI